MSLNGLDETAVVEAYQSSLAEAGGWFLLRYAARDAVELFTRGSGGLPEVRAAITEYDERSPLYGFLLYRRRKVLIRYVPEGTSRLLQARVAVHFSDITDKFSPHDAVLSIGSARELNDTTVSATCSLHTAAPSTCSSSGSSQRKKLDGITEDAEEGQALAKMDDASTERQDAPSIAPADGRPSMEDNKPEPSEPSTVRTSTENPSEAQDSATADVDVEMDSVLARTGSNPADAGLTSYAQGLNNYDFLLQASEERRFSSQTARPSLSELYAYGYTGYKPKVKLGPRPMARPSLDGRRPHTSGSGSSGPVSTLPAGYRIAQRKPDTSRPKSREAHIVPAINIPPPPPIPDIPTMAPRPTSSSGSVKSLPATRSPAMTPEKQRLMKALELRKKKLSAQAAAAAEAAREPSPHRQSDPTQDASRIRDKAESGQADAGQADAGQADAGQAGAGQADAGQAGAGQADAGQADADASKTDAENIPSAEPAVTVPKQETAMEPDTETESAHARPCTEAPASVDDEPNQDDKNAIPVAGQRFSAQVEHAKADSGVEIMIDDRNEAEACNSTVFASSPVSVPEYSPQSSTRPSSVSDEEIEEKPVDVAEPSETPEASVDNSSEATVTPGPGDDRQSSETQRAVLEQPPPAIVVHEGQSGSGLKVEVTDEPVGSDAFGCESKRSSVDISSVSESSKTSIDRKEKRRALVEPIKVDISAENSDADYLSDDSFMEELQSAKVEEAKPMSVSKSPIMPFFTRRTPSGEGFGNNRVSTISNASTNRPWTPGRLSPDPQFGERSPSGSHLGFPRQEQDPMAIAKKINVSSGISQRIKALAENSNRDSTASGLMASQSLSPDASHSIVALRKSSLNSPSLAPTSTPARPTKRWSRASFSSLQSASPEAPKPSLPTTRLPSRDGPKTLFGVPQENHKPESVSVTARIIRDPRTRNPDLTMPTETTPLELHESPIIIDHHVPEPKAQLPTSASKTSLHKVDTLPSMPSSPQSRESSSTNLPRSSSESSWRSFGRRMSESKSPPPAPRSGSVSSLETTGEKKDDKKESRTTRLFRRMSSSISNASRKSLAQVMGPALKEEEQAPVADLPTLKEPPPPVEVGDLNVQFPDTLLWKRRWVEIDGQGNIVLGLSKSNDNSRGITKKYPLSEFRPPFAPDQDRQEMPNSVILDFFDGRTLQCACSDHAGQAHVLSILTEAHQAWLAYQQ